MRKQGGDNVGDAPDADADAAQTKVKPKLTLKFRMVRTLGRSSNTAEAASFTDLWAWQCSQDPLHIYLAAIYEYSMEYTWMWALQP